MSVTPSDGGTSRDYLQRIEDKADKAAETLDRRWNFLTYLIVGLVVAAASYAFSLIPH